MTRGKLSASTWAKVPSGSHPHKLWWVPTPVHPPEGKHAGLRPHQPPLNAFKVHTKLGGPGCHWQHLCPEICSDEASRGWSFRGQGEVQLCGGHVHTLFTHGRVPSLVALAQWPDKGEELYIPMEHAACLAKLDCIRKRTGHRSQDRASPRRPAVEAPLELSKRRLGQRQNHSSDRALHSEESSCLHPTHRPAKEMRARDVQAQTYHRFFRWSDQTEWTPERMGQCPVPLWKPSSTGSRVEASRSSAVATRGSRPKSPERCRTRLTEEVEGDKDSLLKALKKRIHSAAKHLDHGHHPWALAGW